MFSHMYLSHLERSWYWKRRKMNMYKGLYKSVTTTSYLSLSHTFYKKTMIKVIYLIYQRNWIQQSPLRPDAISAASWGRENQPLSTAFCSGFVTFSQRLIYLKLCKEEGKEPWWFLYLLLPTRGFKIHLSMMGIFSDVLCLVLTAVPPANSK